jgi:hypothetical protein
VGRPCGHIATIYAISRLGSDINAFGGDPVKIGAKLILPETGNIPVGS